MGFRGKNGFGHPSSDVMKNNFFKTFLLLLALAAVPEILALQGCTTCGPKGRQTGPEETSQQKDEGLGPLASSSLAKRLRGLKGRIKIVISKSEHRLYLFEDDRLVKSYPIGLGKVPRGDKVRQGDHRTPDGVFYICTKNPKSRFHLSLGISYPTIEDAERGLRQGLISWREYQEIVSAIKRGQRPPWNTALGGAICIHGGGAYWDWTEGCIALDNRDIEELYRIVPVGTPILIVE